MKFGMIDQENSTSLQPAVAPVFMQETATEKNTTTAKTETTTPKTPVEPEKTTK